MAIGTIVAIHSQTSASGELHSILRFIALYLYARSALICPASTVVPKTLIGSTLAVRDTEGERDAFLREAEGERDGFFREAAGERDACRFGAAFAPDLRFGEGEALFFRTGGDLRGVLRVEVAPIFAVVPRAPASRASRASLTRRTAPRGNIAGVDGAPRDTHTGTVQ